MIRAYEIRITNRPVSEQRHQPATFAVCIRAPYLETRRVAFE